MVNPIGGGGGTSQASQASQTAAQTAASSTDTAGDATDLVDGARQLGVLNTELLARDLARVVAHDPPRAAALLAEIRPQLSVADAQQLSRQLAELVDADLTRPAGTPAGTPDTDLTAQKASLALDLVQIGLSIAGIFEPTPFSDAADGLISLFRGDWLGAGISAVSMVPYLGDAAKLGKLGKFAETVSKAVDLAKVDPAFAAAIRPALDNIASALRAVPMDMLPASARETLQSMQRKIDELASAATRTVSRNGYDYTLDAQGRVTDVQGTLVLNRNNARDPRAQREAGGADRLAADQGGHYIARIFDGPVDSFNHFAQNGNFNMGAYRSLERQWDRLLQDGHAVRVQITPRYDGDSLRPDRLTVKYSIDGVPQDPVTFRNRPGGQ